jgi:ribitol 2-dehydrogenase
VQNSLVGKVVIITGASSGIGRAAARMLTGMGCKVSLAARSAEKLSALTAELGPGALAVPTDVTSGTDVERMAAQTVERFGRIDALFANAGLYVRGPIADGDPESWAKLLDVNVTGVMRCARAVLPYMTAQRSGDIVITSSISGCVDIKVEPVYSASKHAIQGFVHTLRRQVIPFGIRVGAIAPGPVADEMQGLTDPAEIDRRVAEHSVVRCEDVVQALVFMLSQPPHVTIRDLVILPQGQDL